MDRDYAILRLYANVLTVLGVIVLVVVVIGAIVAAVDAEGVGATLGVLLIWGPIAVLLSLGTLAIAEALKAIVDIHDRVSA